MLSIYFFFANLRTKTNYLFLRLHIIFFDFVLLIDPKSSLLLFRDGHPPGFLIKLGCGIVSGVMGAIAGVPSDVAMTRMAVDGRLPPEKRRNYKNVIDAFIRITQEEKFTTLFRGITPTVVRAVIVNVSQIVSYAQSKQALVGYGNVDF